MYQIDFSPSYVKTVQKRVKRGVKFLEKTKGPRWFDLIKIKTLTLDDPYMCVLGQTFAKEAQDADGFNYANDKYFRGDKNQYDVVDHGFDLYEDEREWDDLSDDLRKNAVNPWTLLGEIWIDEIRAAKAKAKGKA